MVQLISPVAPFLKIFTCTFEMPEMYAHFPFELKVSTHSRIFG